MSGSLTKVRSGDPMRIPSSTYNAFVDAAVAYRNQQNVGTDFRSDNRNLDVVLMKNESGGDLERFNVLGISDILFSPTDNFDSFADAFVLKGVTPTSEHVSSFAVLLEPIVKDGLGQVALSGAVAVNVNVTNESHGLADIFDGSAVQLQSGDSGSAQILWKEPGTGTKWAIIRFGAGGVAGFFPVELSVDGGSQSPVSSWTYTVMELNNLTNILGTNMIPEQQRPAGLIVHGGGKIGQGYYSGSTLHLWSANETILAASRVCS